MNRCKRAFRSDDKFDQVEFSVSNELVEVVAADATHDRWVPPFDFVSVDAGDIRDTSLEAASRHRFFKFHFPQRASFTGRQHDIHLEDMIDGLAVKNRVRSGRIVAHHAADRGAIGCRGIGPEQESHWPDM